MKEISIDTSTIENYDNMTAEEKVAALEGFKFNDPSDDLATAQEEMKKLKAATDKATHDAADFKKQLKALQEQQGEDGKVKDAEVEALKIKVEELTKANTLTSLKATRLSLGYSEALAGEYAEAQLEGDYAKIASIEKQFLEERDKAVKAELLKQSPKPGQGGSGEPGKKAITKEEFSKMSTEEQIAYKNEHPSDWRNFTK